MTNINKTRIIKNQDDEAAYYEKMKLKKLIKGYKEMACINICLCELGFCTDMEELIEYEKRL